jgi:hypothetical protein
MAVAKALSPENDSIEEIKRIDETHQAREEYLRMPPPEMSIDLARSLVKR